MGERDSYEAIEQRRNAQRDGGERIQPGAIRRMMERESEQLREIVRLRLTLRRVEALCDKYERCNFVSVGALRAALAPSDPATEEASDV